MAASIIRPLRALVKGLRRNNTPRQIAFGVALGMLAGLIPKGNLIAAVLVVLLLSIKVNRGAAVFCALVFSWLGVLLDPLSHRLGSVILHSDSLEPMLAGMYELPVLPWTSFNNTVVLGNLLIGILLFYPTYRAARYTALHYLPPLTERMKRYKIYQVLFGTELVTGWKLG